MAIWRIVASLQSDRLPENGLLLQRPTPRCRHQRPSQPSQRITPRSQSGQHAAKCHLSPFNPVLISGTAVHPPAKTTGSEVGEVSQPFKYPRHYERSLETAPCCASDRPAHHCSSWGYTCLGKSTRQLRTEIRPTNQLLFRSDFVIL